jgi:hypothetical protein
MTRKSKKPILDLKAQKRSFRRFPSEPLPYHQIMEKIATGAFWIL